MVQLKLIAAPLHFAADRAQKWQATFSHRTHDICKQAHASNLIDDRIPSDLCNSFGRR
jgi:hypothetical protein